MCYGVCGPVSYGQSWVCDSRTCTSERAGGSVQCIVGILWFVESAAGGASDRQMDSCGLVGSCFGIFV